MRALTLGFYPCHSKRGHPHNPELTVKAVLTRGGAEGMTRLYPSSFCHTDFGTRRNSEGVELQAQSVLRASFSVCTPSQWLLSTEMLYGYLLVYSVDLLMGCLLVTPPSTPVLREHPCQNAHLRKPQL